MIAPIIGGAVTGDHRRIWGGGGQDRNGSLARQIWELGRKEMGSLAEDN